MHCQTHHAFRVHLWATNKFLQVEKSVADLSRQGFDLRTLLSPYAAAMRKSAAAGGGLSGGSSPRQAGDGMQPRHGVRHWAFEECGFSLAALQGVVELDEIEEIVSQVRVCLCVDRQGKAIATPDHTGDHGVCVGAALEGKAGFLPHVLGKAHYSNVFISDARHYMCVCAFV